MALEHLKAEIWSANILDRLNKSLVYKNIATTEYEGEIKGFGDQVKINEIGPVAVNTYSSTSTGALTIQQLSDAQKILRIDQSKYFAFWVDDEDYAKINPKVMNEAMGEGAFGIANNIDYYISRLYSDAGITVTGTAASGTAVTSTNIVKYLSLAQQKLDEANTPEQGRFIVVPPWVYHKMTLAKIVLDTNNSEALNRGWVGRTMFGFDVYVSNQVYHYTASTHLGAGVLCGYKGSLALAVQVVNTKKVDSATIGFKTLVKSLVVYGAKVLRPNNLGVMWISYTAEAT